MIPFSSPTIIVMAILIGLCYGSYRLFLREDFSESDSFSGGLAVMIVAIGFLIAVLPFVAVFDSALTNIISIVGLGFAFIALGFALIVDVASRKTYQRIIEQEDNWKYYKIIKKI